MTKTALATAATFVLTLAAGAFAQEERDPARHDPVQHSGAMHDHMSHANRHMAASAPDKRELIDFPPEVRDHQLRSMREHMQALSDILTAMGASEYEKAAGIARARLGVDSQAAMGCKGAAGGRANANMSIPAAPDMHQMLARHMPEGMSNLGMAMHRAADDFVATATESARTGDGKPAYAALARVTAGCVACHEAYRTR